MTEQQIIMSAVPDTAFQRRMAEGHEIRMGHKLDAVHVSDDGGQIWRMVRLCCGDKIPDRAVLAEPMRVVTINGNGQGDYDVSVHRAGCRDVPKAIRGHDYFEEGAVSKRDLWLNYNSDFLDEGSGAWPIHFYPCTEGLPEGGSYNTETDEG